MREQYGRDRGSGGSTENGAGATGVPGKRTRTQALVQNIKEPDARHPARDAAETGAAGAGAPLVVPSIPDGLGEAFEGLLTRSVQLKGGRAASPESVHAAASAGVQGPGSALPFLDVIQPAFGANDVSGVRAHTDNGASAAAQQIGATAYAAGNHVAFAAAPDLHTTAHEAAHVVQQRSGIQLEGGVGATGDTHEQEADTVADAVVRGEYVGDRFAPAMGGGAQVVQLKAADEPVGALAPVLEAQVMDALTMPVEGDPAGAGLRRTRLLAIIRAYHRSTRTILLHRFGKPAADDALAKAFLALPAAVRADMFVALIDQDPAATEKVERAAPADEAGGSLDAGERDASSMADPDGASSSRPMAGETSEAVGKIARIGARDGLQLRSGAHHGSAAHGVITFDTLVHVERKTAHGWCYVVVLGDSHNGGPTSGVGFVEGQFLVYDPPEPGAHLHYVKGGEMLKDIAAAHYEPQGGFPRGKDARLYVEALYEVNKDRNAVYRESVDLGFWGEVIRPEAAEETARIWEGVRVREKHALWLPSLSLITRMRSSGEITSGSRVREALRWVGQQNPNKDEGEYDAGFLLGVSEGAYSAAEDLVTGAADLIETIIKLVQDILDKGAQALIDFGKKVVDAFKKLPAALEAMASWFVQQWTQEDSFDRGEFQGKVVGYIAVQVFLLVVTAGESAATVLGGRFANVIKVIKALDSAADPFFYANKLRKVVAVPAKLANKMRKGAGTAADVAEEALEEGDDAARAVNRNKPALETDARSLDGHDFATDFRKVSHDARHIIRQLEDQGWVRVDSISPSDLVEISRWFNKEIGVVQAPYGKLRIILGERDHILRRSLKKNEVFVVHTHPRMVSQPGDFSKDLKNAGEHIEAVIDWSGQFTFYNKHGIKNPTSKFGYVEPLEGYKAAFVDDSGRIVGYAKVDVIDAPGGSIIKVRE